MAAITWDITLPQKMPLVTPETSQETFIESPRDQGPAYRRHRFSTATLLLSPPAANFVFTGTQRATLLNFYDVVLSFGVKAFEWLDPVADLGLIDMRMMARPIFSGRRGDTTAADRLYTCSVQFEILHPSDPNAV